jgi:hypothetical protein
MSIESEMYCGWDSRDILYKGLVINTAWDSDYVKIYDFDPVSDCFCVLLNEGYMTVEEAKAWIDGLGKEVA